MGELPTTKDPSSYCVPGINRPNNSNIGPPVASEDSAGVTARQSRDLSLLCKLEDKVHAALQSLGVLVSKSSECAGNSEDGSRQSFKEMNVEPLQKEYSCSDDGLPIILSKVGAKRRREMPQHASIVNHLLNASCVCTTTTIYTQRG